MAPEQLLVLDGNLVGPFGYLDLKLFVLFFDLLFCFLQFVLNQSALVIVICNLRVFFQKNLDGKK